MDGLDDRFLFGKEDELNDHVLEFKANTYSLSNIAVSRFELISRILLERYKVS